jgi:hypothetical protein
MPTTQKTVLSRRIILPAPAAASLAAKAENFGGKWRLSASQ